MVMLFVFFLSKSRISLMIFAKMTLQIGVKFNFMNKLKSPPKNRLANNLHFPYKIFNNQQLSQIGKKNVALLSKTHDQEHKKNTNSIKKVLKQLTDLKKELKDIKTFNRNNHFTQGLDMSQCRRINAETRKTSQSPSYNKKTIRSNSSSRNKSNSHKKQTSTQTKKLVSKDVNQFSFSIDQMGRSKLQNRKQSQSEEEDENSQFILRKRSDLSTKRNAPSATISRKKGHLTDELTLLQATQLHEKQLNNLKQNLDVLQISSNLFSVEDKLKINIQFQRMSKYLSRLPEHNLRAEQYYENIILYARNLSNQLNNLAIVINRCELKKQLKQRQINRLQTEEVNQCNNCKENEKKGAEKLHRRQIKKMQKELDKYQLQVQYQQQQIKKLTIGNISFQKQIEMIKIQLDQSHQTIKSMQKKNSLLRQEISHLEYLINQIESEKVRQKNKCKLLEQDIRYHQLEIQKTKTKRFYLSDKDTKVKQSRHIQQLQDFIKGLKQKQKLYQSMISDKDILIQELRRQPRIGPNKRKGDLSQEDSIDSADYYRQKIEIEQKNIVIGNLKNQIDSLTQQLAQSSNKNSELNRSLEICLAQINTLHSQIDILELANEKYKDKLIKSKLLTQKKSKKQSQSHNRKAQALTEINQLIRNHRQVEHV